MRRVAGRAVGFERRHRQFRHVGEDDKKNPPHSEEEDGVGGGGETIGGDGTVCGGY